MKKYRIMIVTILAFYLAIVSSINVLGTGVVLNDTKNHIMVDYIGTGDKKYEKEFLQIKEFDSPLTATQGLYFYEPLYEYYAEETQDSDLPDYVLVFAGLLEGGPAYVYGSYGDYIIQSAGYYTPYTLGYCIYLPEQHKVISLREAYDNDLSEINRVFAEYGLGRLKGDLDEDRKLTVKDATYIQKCLAELCDYPDFDAVIGDHEPTKSSYTECKYISDFNRDGERNIKDATAIQKKIAGLPY